MRMAVMSEDDLKVLEKKAKRDKRDGHILSHLIWCYRTMFANACNPNSDVLEFKPEILEAMEAFKIKSEA